jgi:hypothetical protein
VRCGNIQVGDDRMFEELFPEARFNGWSVGELHVIDPRIIPNGRRDLRRLAKVTQQRSAEVPHTVDVIENGNEIRGSSSTLKACVAWD